MASAVERPFVRRRLVESLCAPAKFLSDYNSTAADSAHPRWSDGLLERIRVP
jgi:hypothetical protein